VNKALPKIHYYDQDFVDIYNRTWAWVDDYWTKNENNNGFSSQLFANEDSGVLNQYEVCISSFFLVYCNNNYALDPLFDNFYAKQEEDGAIRGLYSLETGEPVPMEGNPEGVMPPLFAWAEYNFYHKVGQKKRIKEIMPKLEKYFSWLENNFLDPETGLYHVPLCATQMENTPRDNAHFLIDFNTQQAINALYMSALGDVLNDKEMSFKYKKHYFSLKTKINSLMWNNDDEFYYDLDKNGNQVKVKTIASFWTLLAEIPNEDKLLSLIEHMKSPESFGTENPFPSLAVSEPEFSKKGQGFKGSVFTPYTFIIIKGLEKYARYEYARECAIRHMYYILDSFHLEDGKKGSLYEAYKPMSDGPAEWDGNENFPRHLFVPYAGLATITLMIENIVGLYISLPRKSVDWIVPTLELMGIEDLALKRNKITILSNKTSRGWEIRLHSEKLYYFTVNIIGEKKKTLPIPAGKCSMLIEKL